MKRRSEFEMSIVILRALKPGPELATPIMYKANLAWQRNCEILKQLQERGMIHHSATGRHSLTLRGVEILLKAEEVLDAVLVRALP